MYDPDTERNNLAKLRKQLKEEKKGAIRELRKDARFLAGERNRMRDEKDQACALLLFPFSSPTGRLMRTLSSSREQTTSACGPPTEPSLSSEARRRRWSAKRRARSVGLESSRTTSSSLETALLYMVFFLPDLSHR